jgi:hypothetical protein
MARRALRSFSEGGLKAMESFAILIEDAPRGSAGRLHWRGMMDKTLIRKLQLRC